MKWAFFWTVYKANPELHKDTLEQLNMKEFIQSLSYEYQIEVLQNAPENVIQDVYQLLHEKTRKRLGYNPLYKRIWIA